MTVRSSPLGAPVGERYNPDGSIVGEPEVRVRCADCHAPAWMRVSEVERARCPACHDAHETRYRPALTAVDGDGATADQPALPSLGLVDGDVP